MTEPIPRASIDRLSASIVTYYSAQGELTRLLDSLCIAATRARATVNPRLTLAVHLIDNAEQPTLDVRELGVTTTQLHAAGLSLTLHQGYGNVGYGTAHNRVLPQLDSDFHFVLNSDVELAIDSLEQALTYLKSAIEPVLVSPAATDFLGNKQHLCKAFPSLFVFWLRAFAPPFMLRRFAKTMAAYERRDLDASAARYGVSSRDTQVDPAAASEVAIVSGCCMLCQTAALKTVGGFDSRFFLYFEDFDLSLRLSKIGSVMYLPTMKIRHAGGNASKKGAEHRSHFVRSAARFFSKHGWRLF